MWNFKSIVAVKQVLISMEAFDSMIRESKHLVYEKALTPEGVRAKSVFDSIG
jgi:hypothetical protein